MILLFMLQYIMIAMIQVNNGFVNLINSGKETFIKSKLDDLKEQIINGPVEDETKAFTTKAELARRYEDLKVRYQENNLADMEKYSFEMVMIKRLSFDTLGYSVSTVFTSFIFLLIIIYYTIKFLIMYIRRMLTVGFLIAISPLITITYAIDKAGDGQAQAFSAWMKEFVTNVFIQSIHALMYLVFIFSAIFIANEAPLLAIIFFGLLSRAEKIARNIIFQKIGGGTLGSLSEIMPIKKS